MRKLLIRILSVAVTFSIGVGIYNLRPSLVPEPPVVESPSPPAPELLSQSPADNWTSFSDLLTEGNRLEYNGYLIETNYKRVGDMQYRDQGYVMLSKHRRLIRSFDGMAYHPVGSTAGFGLFSFLGTNEKQVAISQDIPRGGAQWIVDLSHTPRIIFDGIAWDVGRESDDCEVKDIDGNGTFEISLPITDFYAMMDKMAVAAIPLPMITFEYDLSKKKYVPINHLLNQPSIPLEPDQSDKSDEHLMRATILAHVLELIYQGKRDQAWQDFNATYNLDDKKEFERRVKAILSKQPVYKYIYKNS